MSRKRRCSSARSYGVSMGRLSTKGPSRSRGAARLNPDRPGVPTAGRGPAARLCRGTTRSCPIFVFILPGVHPGRMHFLHSVPDVGLYDRSFSFRDLFVAFPVRTVKMLLIR